MIEYSKNCPCGSFNRFMCDRHLKDVVTSRTEYEILTLRVNHLESVVEKIEKKIS